MKAHNVSWWGWLVAALVLLALVSDGDVPVLPLIIGFVLALTFVVLLAAFRSVPVAVVTLVLNLLSVGAAYGLLTLVFQHSWAEGLLGFSSTGTVVAWLPLFLFVVLFDNTGTLLGVARAAGMVKADGSLPGLERALVVDSAYTMAGAVTEVATAFP